MHTQLAYKSGVFLRLFDLLQAGAHEVDILIAIMLGRKSQQPSDHDHSRAFIQSVAVLRRIESLTEEANMATDHAEFLDSITSWAALSGGDDNGEPQVAALREEACDTRKKADELVSLLQ